MVAAFAAACDRRTALVWPANLAAPQSAARSGTDETPGVAAAREAARRGAVYVLAHGRVDYDRFREAGLDPLPLGEDRQLREIVPRPSPR